MTNEDKELLLKDLCSRLPYGVIVNLDDKFKFNKGDRLLVKELLDLYCVEGIKPYLRSISSITEREKKEAHRLFNVLYDKDNIICGIQINSFAQLDKVTKWLNKHHFDWRDLIPKGLALQAPEGMYSLNK